METIEKLLENHQIRRTEIRIAILEVFLDKKYALSQPEIEEIIDKKFDRVTIYRTLNSFENQGLVHKVLDTSGVSKYALCHADCGSHKHSDKHIHFSCQVCKNTYCLENIPIPNIELPENYEFTSMSFLAEGICKHCKTKNL